VAAAASKGGGAADAGGAGISAWQERRAKDRDVVREQLEQWGIPCKDLAGWWDNVTLVGLVFPGEGGPQVEGLPVADYYDYWCGTRRNRCTPAVCTRL
jgi:hypothetical protein